MRKVYVCFIASFLFILNYLNAQVSAYSFSESAATYTALSGGTNSTATGDDGIQNGIPIGFNFTFGGTVYTHFCITTNGFIKLGNASTTITTGTPNFTNGLSATATNRPLIAAIWDDNNRNTGLISYAVSGTSPNQVMTVDWNNVNIGGGGLTSANTASYQIKLYESTNVIEIIYGNPEGTAGTLSASIGLNDNTSFLSVTPGSPGTTSSATPNDAISATTNFQGKKYTFTPPACSAPVGLGATTIAATTATVGWSTTGAVSYDWELRTGGACGSGSPIQSGNTATTSVNLTTLTPNTQYTFCVRSNCSGPSTSGWASTTFTTSCTAAALNVVEGFNTSGTAVFPSCWSQQFVTGTSSLQFQTTSTNPTTNPYEGTRYVFWNSYSISAGAQTRLVSLPITTVGTADVDVQFYWYNENNASYSSGNYLLEGVQLQYSTDGVNWTSTGSFVPRHDGTLAAGAGQWNLKTFSLPPGAGNQANLYVGFLFTSYFGDNCSMDQVTVLPSPPCATPGTVAVSNVTATTASVTFTSSGSNFIVEYGPAGFTPGTGGTAGAGGTIVTGTSSPISLTGLTPNTNYSFYIRRVCSGPSYSANSAAVNFTTQCLSTPLNISEGFNTSGPAVFPSCWTQQFVTGNASLQFQTSSTNPTTAPYEGSRYVYWNAYSIGSGNQTRLVSLPINTTGTGNVNTEFYWYNENSASYNSGNYLLEGVQVQYSLDGVNWINAGNFVPRQDATLASGTGQWKLKTISLPPGAGNQASVYVGLLFTSYFGDNCSLDLLSVKPAPAVDAGPSALIIPATSCSNSNPVTIQATVKNFGSATLNFATNPVTVTVAVSGAGTGTLTGTINTGTLAVNATTNVTLTPNFAFSNGGNYNFSVTATAQGDGNTSNDLYTTSVSVNATPVPVIGPSNPRICAGNTIAITTGAATSPITVNSGPITVNVPDASAVGATHTLNLTGIPTGSTITDIAVTINMTHTWDGDMIFNLVAPNGNVLNLINQVGGSGDNFTNTVLSASASTPITSGASPFTGTYSPSAGSGITASAGYTSNVTAFSGLYSVPNGNWTLSMRDAAGGDVGVLTGWQISISFTPPAATWYPRLGLYTDAAATIPYAGTTVSTLYAKPTSSITYTASVTASGCTGSSVTTVLVDKIPAPVITPATPTICNGQIQQLTVTSNNSAASCGVASGALSIAIPDNNAAGITSTLALNCVPAGAVISDIAVTVNLNHTWDGDMIFNLKAPNGNILNLINQVGGSGDNFSNTTIASNGGLSGIASGTPPFLGSFAPSAANGVGPTGFASNVINFTGLYSVPNGNWILAMRDAGGGDLGTLNSWSITIYYYLPDNTTWAPASSLYTDPAATIQYAGTSLGTVYAKPSQTQLYTVTATTPSGCGLGRNVTVSVNQPAAITTQPLNVNICPGQTATFNVAASGAGLTYQWSFNGNPLSNGGNVSGATSATLNLANVSLADQGNYSVQVTGTCPPPSVTSVNAVLGVGQSPIITSQPQSQTVCSGNTASFSVGTSSPGVTYQWYKNGVAMVSGGNIIGATSATLTILSVTATDAGTYTVVINNYCSAAVTSAGGVLTFSASDRWLGAANSDWNNPNNWCNGVPTPTTDVVILAGAPFNPVLSANGDVRNLQIDAGASVTVTGSGWLNIWGSTLTQNGTFNTSVGTISFRNTANLNVPAMNVANLIMNGAGGITMNGNLRVDTALTLTNGNIILGNNNLTMKGGTLGSVSSHIVTSGTGNVTNNNVGVATVVFPVGPSAASYNPLQIANGQGLNYSVGVATGVPGTLAAGTKAINRTWTVSSSSAPASPVQLTFNYADADANAGYNPATNMEAGYFNGTAWVVTTPAGGVQAMGSAAARQVYTTTSNFGTMVVSNVGGLLNIVTGTPNLNTDIFNVKMLPNLVSNQSVLRVNSRRAMNVEWTITDIQGRLIMKFERPILAGQNDINLKLGHLASGSYQLVGYTDKGTTSVVQFVKY